MTSVRKRKMARSLVKKTTKPTRAHRKAKPGKHLATGHPVIDKHWDKKLTVRQNYARMGLAVNLDGFKGAVEPVLETVADTRARMQYEEELEACKAAAVAQETDPAKIPEGEARIVRDPDTNAVVQVIYGTMKAPQAPQKQEPEAQVSVLDEVIQYNKEHAKAKTHTPLQPEHARYIQDLHAKYGDNVARMKWDKKLNPLFKSESQLLALLASWKRDLAVAQEAGEESS